MIQSRIGDHVTATSRRRGDDLRDAFGIFRGLVLGAALWAIVGVVAVSIHASGDARDVPDAPVARDTSAPVAREASAPVIVSIDRGGRIHHR
jgi:hypothetical protein